IDVCANARNPPIAHRACDAIEACAVPVRILMDMEHVLANLRAEYKHLLNLTNTFKRYERHCHSYRVLVNACRCVNRIVQRQKEGAALLIERNAPMRDVSPPTPMQFYHTLSTPSMLLLSPQQNARRCRFFAFCGRQ